VIEIADAAQWSKIIADSASSFGGKGVVVDFSATVRSPRKPAVALAHVQPAVRGDRCPVACAGMPCCTNKQWQWRCLKQ
jgi:hypothetical protein